MPIKIDHELSLTVIALLVLFIVGGFVILYKVRKGNVDDLPPVVTLQPVPPMAHKSVRPPHEFRGLCHSCHPVADLVRSLPRKQIAAGRSRAASVVSANPAGSGYSSAPSRGWAGRWSTGQQAAGGQAPAGSTTLPNTAAPPSRQALQRTGPTAGILTPAEQEAARKMFVEGHWRGMETIDLTPALRNIYKVPAAVDGVIVDEVSLEAAEAGLLAGDVITEIQGQPTVTLNDFFDATLSVSPQRQAEVRLNRLGAAKRIALVAKNSTTLGFAQMEAASPIRPGALSPHRNRKGPCTQCHIIMATGGQLPVDAGDVPPTPPPIAPNARAPHRYRGPCNSCHIIRATAGQQAAQAGPNASPISRNARAPHRYRGPCDSCHPIR